MAFCKVLSLFFILIFCSSFFPLFPQIKNARSSNPEYSLDFIMGKFDPSKHPDFALIAPKYARTKGMFLHKDAYNAFIQMAEAAKKDGVKLVIVSATRNFYQQKRIWEDKWTGRRVVEDGQNIAKTIADPEKRALKILEYSSMPGTSRHHWGSDIDLNNLTNAHFEHGLGQKTYQWLQAHAAQYGFCQPYTAYSAMRPYGYHEEKWHWSYMPISKDLVRMAQRSLHNEMIKGFLGAETATKIEVVKKYVLGISPACL